ncbi:hypothetical protein Xhom_03468 [Xenorhabdus hominickii]|uniref:Uncharacterized protein n=1 Tax=Xenorhabdus hominickii TaxID=351679 RepID=A0A2G0Q2M5_XENHO|nr:hypothetical protein Xhom_03468 [Xenorhabdus hominickii]
MALIFIPALNFGCGDELYYLIIIELQWMLF